MFKISVEPQEIDDLPLGTFKGQIKVIDKPGLDYDRAILYLRRQKILGFDTESRPVFSPGQHSNGVALLQLAGPEKAYLFRTKTLGMRRSLCNLLASEKIIKVGAASQDDVRGLQRIHGFKAAGFVDLQKIAWEWGIRDKSVKKLAANILGCRISKAQQLSNWEAEQLTDAQCRYAATDAWVCREMYVTLLKSEKHPLTPEEQIPPQDRIAREQAQARRQAAAEAQKQAAAGRTKKRRRKKKKTTVSDDKADPKEGQG